MKHLTRQPQPRSLVRLPRGRAGFTLIEALIAVALLGFSLVVMFGFHSQAVRSNMHARKMTDCTYLAQLKIEQLLSLPWSAASRHADLDDDLSDATTGADPFAFLDHPSSGTQPSAVNAAYQTSDTLGQPTYYVTWDTSAMNASETYTRLRVRCQYYDAAFNQWRGTTVSSYRYRDS